MQAYLDPVEQGAVELQEIHYDSADGHSALIARGDEQTQTQSGLFTPDDVLPLPYELPLAS